MCIRDSPLAVAYDPILALFLTYVNYYCFPGALLHFTLQRGSMFSSPAARGAKALLQLYDAKP